MFSQATLRPGLSSHEPEQAQKTGQWPVGKRVMVRQFFHDLMQRIKATEPGRSLRLAATQQGLDQELYLPKTMPLKAFPNKTLFRTMGWDLAKSHGLALFARPGLTPLLAKSQDEPDLRLAAGKLSPGCKPSSQECAAAEEATHIFAGGLVAGRRIVSLSGMTPSTSLAAVVGAVCGGALEKVTHSPETQRVDVHFLRALDADNFVRYATLALFTGVNGTVLRVAWAPNSRGLKTGHSPVPRYITEEVESYHASRTITLSRSVVKTPSKVAAKRRYPDALENFTATFNVDALRWDFAQFGVIIEVTPMVSSKLSVSVQFADIRSAVLAMHTLRQRGSLMHLKYARWTSKFVRDATQRPCLCV